jgi:tetratricopeptide (TPR) repeat protein
VYLIMFQSYNGLKNWNKVFETVDRLDKLVPKTPNDKRLAFNLTAMNIATELRDTKKTVAYAEKVLVLEPRQFNALLIMAMNLPEVAEEAELNKVMSFSKRVLDLDKPEGVPDEQWKNIRTLLHVQIQNFTALILLNKKDYVGCEKAYQELTVLSPKDPAAYYRQGICLYYQVRTANELAIAANRANIEFVNECNGPNNEKLECDKEENKAKIAELQAKEDLLKADFEAKRTKAIDAFARAVAIGGSGPEVGAARSELEKLYRTTKPKSDEKPLDGLDELIAGKKKEMGV